MPSKPKGEPMCAVTIGYNTYLMPAATGMKVVQLLQSAFECDSDWDEERVYVVKELVNVDFRSVRANQIRMPTPVTRLALEHK